MEDWSGAKRERERQRGDRAGWPDGDRRRPRTEETTEREQREKQPRPPITARPKGATSCRVAMVIIGWREGHYTSAVINYHVNKDTEDTE